MRREVNTSDQNDCWTTMTMMMMTSYDSVVSYFPSLHYCYSMISQIYSLISAAVFDEERSVERY
jgi:hypothetical protein